MEADRVSQRWQAVARRAVRPDIRRCIVTMVVLAVGTLSGCAESTGGDLAPGAPGAPAQARRALDASEPAYQQYRLQCGDTLDIKFFYNPELNETVTIRPDGYISLQLVAETKAVDATPAQLTRSLRQLYSTSLRNPDVTVIVKDFASRMVYVGGEVQTVGPVPMPGRLNSLQAILLAGGFKNSAQRSSVIVLRDQGTAIPEFLKVDLSKSLVQASDNMMLQPRDIVFVPKTGVAKLGDFVDQYLNQVVPGFFSLGLMYNLNPEVAVRND